MNISKFLISTTTAFLIFSGSYAIANTTYNHAIIFGDSLSDIGNNKGHATNTNPDGSKPLWANDIMSLFSGQNIYPSTKVPADVTGKYSIDYAWGGAITGGESPVPTLLQQVDLYIKDLKGKADPNAIFFIWCGGNDLIALMKTLPHQPSFSVNNLRLLQTSHNENPELFIRSRDFPQINKSIQNIGNAIATLEQHGAPAAHIFVMDLSDLANTPLARDISKGDKSKLAVISALTAAFDTSLKNEVLKSIPATNLISIDTLTKGIYADPSKYGVTDLHDSCVDKDKIPACKGFIFYDNAHPTIHTHQIIANYTKSRIEAIQ
jgi:phospholipase/lecithinase/hemolysin